MRPEMLNKLVTRIFYEWDIEEVDEHGDIQDHNFSDKCPGIPTDPKYQLVLVRNEVKGLADDFDGTASINRRAWAYVYCRDADCNDRLLPTYFDDHHKVPKRFHAELTKAQVITQAA
jgi:hypothetical protein